MTFTTPLELPRCHRASAPTAEAKAALGQWIEQSALLDMFAATPPALRTQAGLFIERGPSVLAFGAPGIPSMMVNRVFVDGAGLPVSADGPLGVLRRYAARGVQRCMVHLPEPQYDDAWARTLNTAGLVPYPRVWVKLVRDAQPVPEHDVELELGLCPVFAAEAFAELATGVFGLAPEAAEVLVHLVQRPRWHVYVAWDRGVPVATGALYVQGDVGYLGLGATSPAYRGRGLQRALIARRLRVAQAFGCRIVASETGVAIPGQPNPSYDNLRALGMYEVQNRLNFSHPGATFR